MDAIGWEKIIALPAALIVLLAILGFFLRALPSWKDIKLAEIKVREQEAASRTQEASIFGKLSDALNSMSSVMQQTVVDQRRDTEKMHILQRVSADASDKILDKLDTLDTLVEGHEAIENRLAHLEAKCELFEGKSD